MGGGGPGRGWEAGALEGGGRRGPWKGVGGGGPGRGWEAGALEGGGPGRGWEAGALEGGQDGVQKLKRDVLG